MGRPVLWSEIVQTRSFCKCKTRVRRNAQSTLPRQTEPGFNLPGQAFVCGSGAPAGEFGRPSAGVTRPVSDTGPISVPVLESKNPTPIPRSPTVD
jgi:hypothetical protein